MNISLSYYSGLGKRANNEDAVSVFETASGIVAVVADGLGGQDNGEYASGEAVAVMKEILSGEKTSAEVMARAITAANERIFAMQTQYPGAHTTIAAVWFGKNFAEALHVGDTRIYQFRNDEILYQSIDHSAAQLSVLAGDITSDELRKSKDRNKLFRTLGERNMPKIAEKHIDIKKGDRLLICSDGFWEGILESEMLRCSAVTDNAEEWLRKMREIAEPNADDNNTAIAIVVNG